MPENGTNLTFDGILGGSLKIFQPKEGFRASIDAILLAASVNANLGQSVLELGCGVGTALLCLCQRIPGIEAHGLEIQSHYAELSRRNASQNGLHIEIWEGDVAQPPSGLKQHNFDWVMANPPFREVGIGKQPTDASRQSAETESVPLSEWTGFAARRLKPRGWLVLILPPRRLPDLLTVLPASFGGIEIKPIRPLADKMASRFVFRAQKESNADLRISPELVLHSKDPRKYSRGAEAVLRDGALIDSV